MSTIAEILFGDSLVVENSSTMLCVNYRYINLQNRLSEGPKCKTVSPRGASPDSGIDITCISSYIEQHAKGVAGATLEDDGKSQAPDLAL